MVRFAKAQVRALGCLIAGALLLPAILAAVFWRTGGVGARAIGVAVGLGTLIELVGVVQLVLRGRAMQRYRLQLASQSTAPAATPMQVHFCQRSLGRLGPGMEPLLGALRDRGHTPVVRECLNCCQDCNLGMLVTRIDGTPMSVADGDKLLGELDELSAAESI